MKLKAVSGIMLTLLLIGMLTLAYNIDGGYVLADGNWNITTVDNTGDVGYYCSLALDGDNNPHISYHDSANEDLKYAFVSGSTTHHVYPGQSIQDAINSAQSGDTILVHAGIYREYVTVNKTLSLIGEERDTTIIESAIRESGTGIIVFVTANNVVISGFTIRNASETQNPDPLIYENHGIGVNSNFTNVMGNIITNTAYGIVIGGCSDVIYGNILTHNWRATAGGGYGSTIINNLVSNNSNGICPYWCENNTITSNTIINNVVGIDILMDVINITITNNTIVNNSICFTFGWSSGAIYHNNFLNSTAGGMDPSVVVTWDNGYPSGGNYWSDYADLDVKSGPYQNLTGVDGIWDTPYVIDENHTDTYPLVSPYWYWSNPIIGDINKDMKVDMDDVVIPALAFGSYPGHPKWNPTADLNKDNKVDIDDVVLVAIHFGEHI